jgi:hypothetical protein
MKFYLHIYFLARESRQNRHSKVAMFATSFF